MKDTIIISAFPATGKTCATERILAKGHTVLDSDSSNFSWTRRKRTPEELGQIKITFESEKHLLSSDAYINKIRDEIIKVRNPEFPNNYIRYIKENIGKVDFIFVSSHEEVRKAMGEAGIEYILVYPYQKDLKEYIGRCYLRELEGNQGFPIKTLVNNWDNWINTCENDTYAKNKHHLNRDMYLTDFIEIYMNTSVKSWV